MRNNKWIILNGLMLLVGITLTFTACKKDKEDNDPSADNARIAGVWSGYNQNNTIGFVLGLYNNNSMRASMIYTDENNKVQTEESTGTYRYNSASGELTLYYSEGDSETFRVANLTSVSFTLYIGNSPYYMKKSSNSSSSSGSSSSSSSSGGSSSGSSSKTKCKYCLGNGKCYNYVSSTANKYYCHGSTKCQWCGGDGLTDGFGINNVTCPNCYLYKGSGMCNYCEGSGKCSHCKGSGYQ